MAVLVSAFLLFLTAFLIHVVIWRIRIPARVALFLFAYFLLFFLASVAGIAFLRSRSIHLPPFTSLNIIGLLHVSALYLTAMVVYVTLHTAIIETSPTFLILLSIKKAGDKGKSRDELALLINDEKFVRDKVEGLLRDQNAKLVNGRIYGTEKGFRLLKFFTFYRSILGVRESRG